jgi:hypothetical protein
VIGRLSSEAQAMALAKVGSGDVARVCGELLICVEKSVIRHARAQTILTRRANTKLKTIELRCRLHHQAAATTSTQMDQTLS